MKANVLKLMEADTKGSKKKKGKRRKGNVDGGSEVAAGDVKAGRMIKLRS